MRSLEGHGGTGFRRRREGARPGEAFRVPACCRWDAALGARRRDRSGPGRDTAGSSAPLRTCRELPVLSLPTSKCHSENGENHTRAQRQGPPGVRCHRHPEAASSSHRLLSPGRAAGSAQRGAATLSGWSRPRSPRLAAGSTPPCPRSPTSRAAAGRALTLTADPRRAGSEQQQQQRARRGRRPALHHRTRAGLAVPSRGAGRASPAAPAAVRSRPRLVAESRPRRPKRPVFYPRQSPPSGQRRKPFRPCRPGTSMRESGGAGPLPPGPPPAPGARTCARSHVRRPSPRARA